jgi:hypothetical protein
MEEKDVPAVHALWHKFMAISIWYQMSPRRKCNITYSVDEERGRLRTGVEKARLYGLMSLR